MNTNTFIRLAPRLLLAITLLNALASCSVNISPAIAPPVIQAPSGLSDRGKGAMVFVEEVRDERDDKSLGRGPNGPIQVVGTITGTVRDGLEDLLRKSGFTVTDSAPVILQTSLQKWDAQVLSGGVSSEAKVTLQVFDPANRLAYTGHYQGNAEIQQGSLDDRIVKETMTSSMGQVIEQIRADKALMRLLSAY